MERSGRRAGALDVCRAREGLESDRRVDIVAQDGFAGFDIG